MQFQPVCNLHNSLQFLCMSSAMFSGISQEDNMETRKKVDGVGIRLDFVYYAPIETYIAAAVIQANQGLQQLLAWV